MRGHSVYKMFIIKNYSRVPNKELEKISKVNKRERLEQECPEWKKANNGA